MSAGFPRSARLLKPAQFKQVISGGRRRRSPCFTAFELRQPEQVSARLGLAVAKKVLPLAVERNRFKRLVRESFRRQYRLPPCDVVIMATPAARQMPGPQLLTELAEYWGRLRERWPVS